MTGEYILGEKIEKLDIHKFSDEIKSISIGKLSDEMIKFIVSKNPEFEKRLNNSNDILFWVSRIKHTEKHISDFATIEEFYKCLEDIPGILKNPDYISIHPKDESISFIKDYSKHTSVAIKIASDGVMSYRTMYPLTDYQLINYINNGRAWKYKI